ncbi:MAG: DUF3168 domain-containing protein [Pseudomonadota bacterium]
MSFDGFLADAEAGVINAVLSVLRNDDGVSDALGEPARVFDSETEGGYFPYVRLERHRVRPADTLDAARQEHEFQFESRSKFGGFLEAKTILGALRTAIEVADWDAVAPEGQRIVMAMVTYADVMRTRRGTSLRGVFRVKLLVEDVHG